MANLFDQALAAEGVSGKLADVARSIYHQESTSGQNAKTSNAGAVGGMQILPTTFASVADKGWNIDDPLLNARAGIRYLGQMFQAAGGDPALAAAGYYGGKGGLEKARKGIAVSDPRNPNAPNTLQYGQQVAGRLGSGTQESAPAVLAQAPLEISPASKLIGISEADVLPPPPDPADVAYAKTKAPPEWDAFVKTLSANTGVSPADLATYGTARPAPAGFTSPALAQMIAAASQPSSVNFAAFAPRKTRV